MEKFQELRDSAKKKLQIADHILTQTYPLIKDTKLLLMVLENIFLAMTHAMSSLLYYERLFKRIPPFQDAFDSKFNMFRARLTDQYKIDQAHVNLLQDIRNIITEHKRSPVEFTRKDCFVICSDNYELKTVTLDKLREYFTQTKSFVNHISGLVSKNEDLFKK